MTLDRSQWLFWLMLWFTAGDSVWVQAAGTLTVRVGAPPVAPTLLVSHGDLWRYRKGTSAPPTGWQTNTDATLDSSWLSGPGGFGYGDNDDATVLADMQNNYTAIYIRKTFNVTSELETNPHLRLVMDFDDGFVAWLDGAEIARANALGSAGSEPLFSAVAPTSREASNGDNSPQPPISYDLGPLGDRLRPGAHVLAVLGLNQASSSSDLSLIADLSLVSAQSNVSGGVFFALVPTNSVLLSGTNTISNSVRVVVNGSDAVFNPAQGSWSKSQSLAAGFNHLVIQALDAAGTVLGSTNQEIVAELSASYVGGLLASATQWTSAMGIIHATNHVIIPSGGTLTISPGAVVLLGAGVSIYATNASLSVAGSASNAVYFLPADGSTVWGELLAAGATGHLSMQHAETIAGHLEMLEGASGLIEDCYLHDYLAGSTPIIHTLRPASLTMRRCHVARYFEILSQIALNQMEDCLMEYISGDGIDFDAGKPGSFIRRCTLRHGDATNVDGLDMGSFPDGTPTTGVLIEDCLIYDFPFDKGVSIGEGCQNMTVRNCLMYQVDSGVAVKDSSVAVIYNLTVVDSDYGLRLYQKNAGQGGGHATAYNNILWDVKTNIFLDSLSSIVVSDSDVTGPGIFPGTNNLNSDPLFLDSARRDYRLATNSPCIGTGRGGIDQGVTLPVGTSLLDTDGDGMPDNWEAAYGFDANDASDAGQDNDHDGSSNVQEYHSGTNPLDSLSVLKIKPLMSTDVSNGAVAFYFTAMAGISYSVEYRESLYAGSWSKLFPDVTSQSTNRVAEVRDTNASAHARFYRLVTPMRP